jgi:hypothetical protein
LYVGGFEKLLNDELLGVLEDEVNRLLLLDDEGSWTVLDTDEFKLLLLLDDEGYWLLLLDDEGYWAVLDTEEVNRLLLLDEDGILLFIFIRIGSAIPDFCKNSKILERICSFLVSCADRPSLVAIRRISSI